MPKIDVIDMKGKKVSDLELADSIFGIKPNEAIVHSVLVNYLANQRQGTQSTKTRAEVRGGGKKPWRQKGTGRARAGSTRSPIWVGGGTVFGPSGIQNFKVKQNKKEHDLALKGALSLKAKKDMVVLNSLEVSGKTKEIVNVLKTFKLEDEKTLVVTSDEKVLQGSNNIPSLILRSVINISVYDFMNATKV